MSKEEQADEKHGAKHQNGGKAQSKAPEVEGGGPKIGYDVEPGGPKIGYGAEVGKKK